MPKMTLEHARKLRDQERGKVAPPPMFDPHPGDTKQREIRFDHARQHILSVRPISANAEDTIARVERARRIAALAGCGCVSVELSGIERVRVSGAVDAVQLDAAIWDNASLAL